jgi:pimeloyl-ACP methyl ester carboxylesterase
VAASLAAPLLGRAADAAQPVPPGAPRATPPAVPTPSPAQLPVARLEPLDIDLRGFEYPFPVRFMPVVGTGVPPGTHMAFMDVRPMLAGNGTTVILMHGRNFPSSYWQHTATNLSARGYRVIVPDQIGFGKSSKAAMPYSFAFWADTTAALAKMLQVKKAVVLGHSIGGIMATTLAVQYPDLVTKLVLEDPLGLEDYRTLVPEVADDVLYERELKLTPDAYREQLKTAYFPTWKPEYEQFVTIRARQMLDKAYPRWVRSYIQSYQLLHETPIAQALGTLAIPVTIIVGESDTNAPGKAYAPEAVRAQLGHNADLAAQLAPKLQHGTAITLPNLGHVPHLEDPNAFDDAFAKALA